MAVMASAINYNTVWTSIFEPVSTFGFLERYGRNSELTKRHDLPYHVVGSDLSGVVLKTGPGVTKWKPGDRVVAHCLSVELEGPDGHNDTMLDTEQRIWGFETNFGGLADVAMVKANQLMPKPEHLTWEEAASPGLVNCTAYRQLVCKNGGDMKQGDNVLIWGASGGLGGFATQYALNGGATPVCVVSNEEKAAIARSMGAELIINRSEEDYKFWNAENTQQDPQEWKRFGAKIRELTGGEDIDIVFEHPGRETFGASVFVTRKGGTITTCASTSGYMHEYDNRYLWMNLKRIISSHFANYRESWEANRLIAKGRIHPTLSKTYTARGGRPGLPRRPPERPPGQGRRPLPGPRGGPRRPRPRDARPARDRDQPLPRGLIETSRPSGAPRFAVHPRAGVFLFPASARLGLPQSARRESGYRSMSRDQGLSIFDEPESEDGAEETQVLPVTPTDATPDAEPDAEPRQPSQPQAAPGRPAAGGRGRPPSRSPSPPARLP